MFNLIDEPSIMPILKNKTIVIVYKREVWKYQRYNRPPKIDGHTIQWSKEKSIFSGE